MMKISSAVSVAASGLAIGVVCYSCFYFWPEELPSYADKFVPLDGSPGVARRGHSIVDTGSSILLWGGNEGSLDSALNNGLIYSYMDDSWNEFYSGEIEPRSNHVSVWTGNEMIVWGGFLDDIYEGSVDRLSSNGFAFSPDVGLWRDISDAPLGLSDAEAFYSEGYVVIAGGVSADGLNEDVLLYDLEENSWRSVPNDFVTHSLHELPSGDIVLTGIDPYKNLRVAVFSIDEFDVSEITVPGFLDLDIHSYSSVVSSEGVLILVTSGENILVHQIDVNGKFHRTYRMRGGPVYGLTDHSRSSLSDGELWLIGEELMISVSGNGVSFLGVGEGRIQSFSSDEIDGHCGTGVESIRVAEGLIGIGGLGCDEYNDGFLLPIDSF